MLVAERPEVGHGLGRPGRVAGNIELEMEARDGRGRDGELRLGRRGRFPSRGLGGFLHGVLAFASSIPNSTRCVLDRSPIRRLTGTGRRRTNVGSATIW